LESIRAGYLANQELLSDIRYFGHTLPGNRSFALTHKGGKARYEIDYDQDGRLARAFRLDDGNALYKLDDKWLSILSRDNRDEKWASFCSGFSLSEHPLYEGEALDVAGRCQWISDVIQGRLRGEYASVDTKGLVESGQIVFSLGEHSTGVIEITISAKNAPVPLSVSMHVDPNQGYCLRRWLHYDGAFDPAQWQRKLQIDNSFREVVPGAFALSRSVRTGTESGTAPDKEGRSGTFTHEVVVDRVEVGEFEFADDYFSVHSLPIEEGTHVEDRRVEPALHSVYSSRPINLK